MIKISDFDYNIPKELIAQHPSDVRGRDRLIIIDKEKQAYHEEAKGFEGIADYFKKGDLLVLNNTKVIPARLYGKRKTGGNVEIFVIDRTKRPMEALVKPSARIKEGETIMLESGDEVKVLGRTALGRLVEFAGEPDDIIRKTGHIPLPPYITRPDTENDKLRYQTVFAARDGATASPTASLHFTEDILDKLKKKGVEIAFVTLHVSYGTFAPVKEDDITKHKMHSEYYNISKNDVAIINEARNRGARIIAAGTTALRVLEACADEIINFIPQAFSSGGTAFEGFEGFTDLFIYPGYEFRIAKGLITNFHLPKSTLILLACAFTGKDLLFDAYRYAIGSKFRFFSYGDATFIV